MGKRGILFVFSGPSGVGKDTILGAFLPGRSDIAVSISATTRPPRADEREGEDYYFIDRERFEAMVEAGEMLEFAEYGGNCYGTPKQPVEDYLDRGIHVILEIELVGAMKVKALLPQAVFIFVMPPSIDVLRNRLVSRGTETEQSVDRRMEKAREEIAQAGEYDYILVNNTIAECCRRLDAVITAETCRASYMKPIIREVIEDA